MLRLTQGQMTVSCVTGSIARNLAAIPRPPAPPPPVQGSEPRPEQPGRRRRPNRSRDRDRLPIDALLRLLASRTASAPPPPPARRTTGGMPAPSARCSRGAAPASPAPLPTPVGTQAYGPAWAQATRIGDSDRPVWHWPPAGVCGGDGWGGGAECGGSAWTRGRSARPGQEVAAQDVRL